MGGGQFLDFMGVDTAVMTGDIELMGGSPSPPPPTRENPDIRCHDSFFYKSAYKIDRVFAHLEIVALYTPQTKVTNI